jgi:Planctomycete cytochrome C
MSKITMVLLAFGLVSSAEMRLKAADKDKKPVDVSKLVPPADKKGLTYERDIKPIVEKSCVKCHSGEKAKSKYHMETLQGLIKGGESGDAAIIPGQSAKSPLVHYVSDLVEDMEMPPTEKRDKYPALTKEQIGLIRAWIDQGAK